jgi:hypothetical protein
MSHISLTTYLWGLESQNRFLASCLAPTIDELRRGGLVSRFWFERMDIRGPHIFAPIRVAEGAVTEVSQQLADKVGSYLAVNPCMAELSAEELRHRHDFCRGKVQSAADHLEGFAENNSFLILDHEERDYPFRLSADLPREEVLWSALTDLTMWAISQLPQPESIRRRIAIECFAVFDQEVWSSEVTPERYWRYHATSLLIPLKEALGSEEERILSQLPSAIGDRNSKLFTRIWGEVEEVRASILWIGQIVRLILNTSTPSEPQRFALLREVIHCVLKQLSLMVSFQLPLVLFAWNRSLALQLRRGVPEPRTLESLHG